MNDEVRDAYQLTVEVMAKCIEDTKKEVQLLRDYNHALQHAVDTRDACIRDLIKLCGWTK